MKWNKLFLFCILASSSLCCFKGETIIIIPGLKFSHDSLIFINNETRSLYITLEHVSESQYQIIESPEWLEIDPTSGYLTGQLTELILNSKLEDFPSGTYEDQIVFFSNLGTDTIKVTGIAGDKLLLILPDTIHFPQWEIERVIKIKNTINETLNFSIDLSDDFISVNPISGNIGVGQEMELTIQLNRDDLQSGNNYTGINFDLNGIKDTIDVRIHHVVQQKKLLHRDIIEADFSPVTNMIVWASSSPMAANIYNTNLNTITSIPLNFLPTCIAVSPDGTKAAVGHDAHVSYVDLINLSVINTFEVPCYAFDIVLNDVQIIVSPKDGQHTRFQCINLSDNSIQVHTGQTTYHQTKIVMHPEAEFLYSTETTSSPPKLRKFDARTFPAKYMYESPQNNFDFQIGHQIWVNSSGDRIFAETGNSFRSSSSQATDMLYAGKINTGDFNKIESFHHSVVNKEIYAVRANFDWYPENFASVDIYDETNYTYKSKINLENYIGRDAAGDVRVHAPKPLYVFCHSDGSTLFVLMKDRLDPFDPNWAIQKIDRY